VERSLIAGESQNAEGRLQEISEMGLLMPSKKERQGRSANIFFQVFPFRPQFTFP
jgi:hypothetical protein